jgi:hypothetical protein
MKDWLLEAIDQVALGEFMAASRLSCGQRFGLIAVDNAIEFMLIAYIEADRQLVGAHKPGGIPKKEWGETKDKFPKLLAFVAALATGMSAVERNILRYHDLRNGLYHSGSPTTVSHQVVRNYSRVAIQVLTILFNMKFSDSEWSERIAGVEKALLGERKGASLRAAVEFTESSGIVKFTCSHVRTAKYAIALAIYGFSIIKGARPDRAQLEKALAMSGHTLKPEVVTVRVAELRREGWVQRDALLLTSKGTRELTKLFAFRAP